MGTGGPARVSGIPARGSGRPAMGSERLARGCRMPARESGGQPAGLGGSSMSGCQLGDLRGQATSLA